MLKHLRIAHNVLHIGLTHVTIWNVGDQTLDTKLDFAAVTSVTMNLPEGPATSWLVSPMLARGTARHHTQHRCNEQLPFVLSWSVDTDS